MKQSTADVLKQLESGVKSLLNSEEYRRFLSFMSSLPRYSYRNSALIYLQCKQRDMVPTMLASYSEWRKRHRHVKRGETGIKIFAPHKLQKKIDGDDDQEEKVGFHLATTFDVSQTEADDDQGEIPEICHNLEDNLTDRSILSDLVTICPISVKFGQIKEKDVNGYFSTTENEICVDNTNSETQQVKTLVHELSHYWHHRFDKFFLSRSREVREIIAESCAYVVCQRLAVPIDSSSYSFGYLASYSSDSDLTEFKQNLNWIQRISSRIITDLDDLYASKKESA